MLLNVALLRSLRPQNQFHYWPSLPSTMPEASRLAASGAAHGTVVLTDEQTAGVGRLGRSWISEAELGIYCSIVLRIPLEPPSAPIASLVLGLATAEAIETASSLACDLRWPNDVLINERKVAGMLAQLSGDCVVAGIGINVNHSSFPGDLRTPATSLFLESGGRQEREPLIVQLLESIDRFCATWIADGNEAILRAFSSASSYALNRRVVVEETGARGITSGLDESGFLLLRSESGQVRRLAAGGVRPDHSVP